MLVKECRDCGQVKPVSEFFKRKASKDGLALYCKDCFALRNYKSRRKRLEREGKECGSFKRRRVVPEGMKYCPHCEEVKPIQEFGRNRSEKSGLATYCRPCHNVVTVRNTERKYGSRRNYLLQLRYRVTAEQIETYREGQGGVCVICLGRKAGHVDHDHMTGVFRGVLCFPCNGALGQYDDDPWRMRESARYLEGTGSHSRMMLLEFGVLTVGGRTRQLVDGGGRRVKRVGTNRDDHLRAKYGLGQSQVDELLHMQRGLCAICCDRKAEAVDHDHRTGAVRGILCGGCNTGMGQLGDDPVALRRAADYVLGDLVRQISTDDGGIRFSFTFPDIDPKTVPEGGWESYRAKDGEHRKLFLEIDDGMHIQTRLKLAPGKPTTCRRHAYTGPRPTIIDKLKAMLEANPEHARHLDELLARA